MTPDELNANFQQAVLYYVFQQGDTTLYATDLSNLCTMTTDGSGYLEVLDWIASVSYAVPSNTTLQGYTVAQVVNYYNQYYNWPTAIRNINAQTFLQLTTSELNTVQVDSSFTGYLAFSTDDQKVMRYTGSAWVGLW